MALNIEIKQEMPDIKTETPDVASSIFTGNEVEPALSSCGPMEAFFGTDSSDTYPTRAIKAGAMPQFGNKPNKDRKKTKRHGDKSKASKETYLCHHCLFQPLSKMGLAAHIRYKHGPVPETIRCSLCPYITSSIEGFKIHLVRKHEPKPLLECAKCSFKTKSVEDLKKHEFVEHCGDGGLCGGQQNCDKM